MMRQTTLITRIFYRAFHLTSYSYARSHLLIIMHLIHINS